MVKIQDSIKDADMFSEFLKHGKSDENDTYFSPIFLFSNDEIDLIIKNMDFTNGLLSVTSSLDHTLNAVLNGAKEITLFDINKAAKYFAELKLQAIINLDYKQFLSLYGLEQPRFPRFSKRNVKLEKGNNFPKLNKQMVCEVCKNMEMSYSLFFERLLNNGFFEDKKLALYFYKNALPNINSYLTEEEFYRLKKLLHNVSFKEYIDCNIFDLKKHIGDSKYSAMIFSNITSYFRTDDYKRFQVLLSDLKNNLTDEGLAQIGYGFIYTEYDEYGVKPISDAFISKNFKYIDEEISKGYKVTYFHKYNKYE